MVEDLLDVRRLDNKRVIVKATTGSACHNDRSQDRPMIVQRHACSAARQLAQQVNGFGRQRHGDRRVTRADTQNFSNIAQKIQSLGSPFNPMPPYATSQTAATIYVT
jgi:GDP-D-mannose dehydratase